MFKFGRTNSLRFFENGGRYYNEFRALRRLCGSEIPDGDLNALRDYAIDLCVLYHFQMMAVVGCWVDPNCMDNMWRCAYPYIDGYRITHFPLRQARVPHWLKSGKTEFFRVNRNDGGEVTSQDLKHILERAFHGTYGYVKL